MDGGVKDSSQLRVWRAALRLESTTLAMVESCPGTRAVSMTHFMGKRERGKRKETPFLSGNRNNYLILNEILSEEDNTQKMLQIKI